MIADMNEKKIRLADLHDLPKDIKDLSYEECDELCRDIRRTIVRTVMKNGGHLSSNLGTVELIVAMHRVFDSPEDKFVFDVGHQAYTHKLLTGRLSDFPKLRKENGLSGFTRPSESEHDAFISGHSSTSVSAALGMAEAMKLSGDNVHHAIAVIGDGALTGGMAYEGLNNAGKSDAKIIVILNHNDMSISKNVGALAKYLTKIRGNSKYLNAKKAVKNTLSKIPVGGETLTNAVSESKAVLKGILYHSTMFEDLGFVYLGPVDGHNVKELQEALESAKRIDKPVFVHVNTVKGKGFRPAEDNPGAFHGVPAKAYVNNDSDFISEDSFSAEFGRKLNEMADRDERICAITAAMKYGTGLQYFAASHKDRFFDVGIAEQHAVTFACGLAKCGKIPVFAVYSSFIQRSFDQLIHDCSIEPVHVVFGIDRAGIVGEDGETHQGIFDVPMLTCIPHMTVYSPSCYDELKICLDEAVYKCSGPVAVRYPRGADHSEFPKDNVSCTFKHVSRGSDILAVTYGRIWNELFAASEKSADFDMLKLTKIFPISKEVFEICRRYRHVYFFEEGIKSGGIGEHLAAGLSESGIPVTVNAADDFIKQAPAASALSKLGLDESGILHILKKAEKQEN